MSFPLLIPLLIAMLVLLAGSAFCSGSEGALISLNKVRLKHQRDKGNSSAKILYGLVTHLDRFIASILVLNNIVNVAFSAIGTLIFIRLLGPLVGDLWASVIATFVITMALLVFAEITPKVFSIQHSEKVAYAFARPVTLVVRVMEPAAKFFTTLSNALIRLFGGSPPKRSPLVTEEEIRLMIEVGKEEAMKRNLLRGRTDDTKQGIEKRFDEYINKVIPAMNYFKGKPGYELYTINGEQSVADVHKDIINKLGFGF